MADTERFIITSFQNNWGTYIACYEHPMDAEVQILRNWMKSWGCKVLRLTKTRFLSMTRQSEVWFGTSISTRTIAKMTNEWSQQLDNHTSFKQKMGKSVIFYDQLIEKELVTHKLWCLIILWSNDSFYSIFPSISWLCILSFLHIKWLLNWIFFYNLVKMNMKTYYGVKKDAQITNKA